MTIRSLRPLARGQVVRLRFSSQALANNPWGDPAEREVPVYLPAGFSPSLKLPLMVSLAGYTSSGLAQVNWRGFEESLPERLDRLIASAAMGPVVVLMPDCFTTLGGNQYINSPAVGAYADYVLDELIGLVEAEFATDPARRAVFGKSSGGYGAMVLAMRYPGRFAAAASHAGDVGFETLFKPAFPAVATALRECQGDLARFLKKFWNAKKIASADLGALMMCGMAASFDPDPSQSLGFCLPFDLNTCQVDQARWRNWLEHDPLVMLERHSKALKTLRKFYLDVGTRDEYHTQYGSRLLHARLDILGVDHHFEEFDGTHSGIDHRLDVSLPTLYAAL